MPFSRSSVVLWLHQLPEFPIIALPVLMIGALGVLTIVYRKK